jgi:cytochrome c biogenesis protein CcmG, thiol:disulfide interchange protein DsbE
VRRYVLIVVFSLLLTSCSSNSKQPFNQGFVPNCEVLDTSIITKNELNLKCLDNSGEINFHSIKGPIVVNVWGSWCEGCRDEMPYFIDLYQRAIFKSGQIKLLGVDVEESSMVAAKSFIKAYGMSWPHLVDSDGRSKGLFGPGVPVTWFIDERGEVVGKKIGAYLNNKQLFSQVENAFGVKL